MVNKDCLLLNHLICREGWDILYILTLSRVYAPFISGQAIIIVYLDSDVYICVPDLGNNSLANT